MKYKYVKIKGKMAYKIKKRFLYIFWVDYTHTVMESFNGPTLELPYVVHTEKYAKEIVDSLNKSK